MLIDASILIDGCTDPPSAVSHMERFSMSAQLRKVQQSLLDLLPHSMSKPKALVAKDKVCIEKINSFSKCTRFINLRLGKCCFQRWRLSHRNRTLYNRDIGR